MPPTSRKKPLNRPLFITLEGTEGSGKSSFITALKIALENQGISCVATREPGGAEVAEKIRAILLHESMHPLTELFLYEAARAEHLHTVIVPALKSGSWVICDRFTDSTLAYQGTARGIDRKLIRKLNAIATSHLEPDATLFLDIDPEAGLKSAQDPNRFEREGVQFQKKVRSGFLKTIAEEPKRFIRLKAKQASPEKMAELFLKALEKKKIRKTSAKTLKNGLTR
jgi:dTMP kinase